MNRLISFLTMLFASCVLALAQVGTDTNNGTQHFPDKTVGAVFSQCEMRDRSEGPFIDGRSQNCPQGFVNFTNGGSRKVSDWTLFGFPIGGGEQFNAYGTTACAAAGNSFAVRNIWHGESPLQYFIGWELFWYPRKPDNSLDTANMKQFKKLFCESAKQVAEEEDEELPPENCPLAIDLNGDGVIRMTNRDNGVNFDLNNDGVAERLPWLADGDDGWVVFDMDENGVIPNGKYLFGNNSIAREQNGYAVLRHFDENKESKIDIQDGIYPRLGVWRDANHNGVSDPGEVTSLSQWATDLSLDFKESRRKDQYGNETRFKARYTKPDGSKGWTFDIIMGR